MLNAVSGGPTGAPTFLLIHPMGADLAFWDACRARLDRSWRCIAVDLRGAGGSAVASRPVPIDAHAHELASFCDEKGLKRVIVVGCAVGAMIATAFAGLHPDRCAAVLLCNPGFRTLPAARENLARRAAAAREGGMAAIVAAATDAAFFGCPSAARRDVYVERFVRQDPEQYALQIEGMLDADTSPYLGGIASPVLIVAGGQDLLLPPGHALNLRERIADAAYMLMPAGAHFIPWQRPTEFAALADAFARRVVRI